MLKLIVLILCLVLILCQSDYYQDRGVLTKEEVVTNNSNPSVSTDTVDPLANLSPSVPLHLTIPAIGVDHSILEYSDEMVVKRGGVNPVSWNDVDWWSGGGRPGTTLDNTSDVEGKIDFTTYLYGHSTNCDSKKVIFDDLDLLNTGDQIIITTKLGKFIYSVDEVFIITKTELMTDVRATEDVPGRLLLISCWRSWSGSGITTDNDVVIANLTNFVPTN